MACSSQGSVEIAEDVQNPPEEFRLLNYNNPDLTVDLGVGLWAWPLPMDYDEDGDMDMLVSCPDTPFNGLYFFENDGDTVEGMSSFKPPVKIGPSVRNIQLSYVNGEPKVMAPGVEYQNFRDATLNSVDTLFDAELLEGQHEKIRFSQWKYVDYENDGDLDIIVGIDEWGEYGWDNAFDEKGNWTNGPLHGHVYLLENVNGKYENKGKLQAADKPLDVYGAPSPNMYDFDGDGDLDLICGEFLDKLSWFENTGTRENPVYAEGRMLKNAEGIIKMDLEMIIPVGVDWDKDGDMDLVIGDEDGRVALIENTGVLNVNMPVFESPVYFKQQAEHVKFGALVTPYSVDWDNDGDEDLICGNSAGYIGFIENLDGGSPPQWDKPKLLEAEGETIRIMAGENGSIQGPAEAKWGYTTLSVNDWDGDGLLDIIVNSIWGKVEWYKNIGSKNSPRLANAQPVKVQWEQSPPKPAWNWWNPESDQLSTQWRTTPVTTDWDEDGLMDLMMLDHEGYLVLFERFEKGDELFLQPGKRVFYGVNGSGFDAKHGVKDSTAGVLRLNVNPYGSSGRRKLAVVDWDGDGDKDLLVNSLNVSLMENLGVEDGMVNFRNVGTLAEKKLAGHTTSPTIVDWDKDGKPALLLGAEDGHLYYLSDE
ncbi:VCBS repeat-containing protein [Catalinimonas sp. 4WD22]|uniref:FG-GAP repeat domain-containing protein n=1 Tax=Catalinimonas locisalis TaxID=3133978 RepID=UPI003101171D